MKQSFVIDEEVVDKIINTLEACLEKLAQVNQFLQEKQTPEEVLLTQEEAAKLLKVSRVTIWDWSRKGILNARDIGKQVRYLRSELIAAAKSRRPNK